MKRLIFILLAGAGLLSCKAIVNEVKKMNLVRSIVRDLCECKIVNAEKYQEDGNPVMTITITESISTDHLATTDAIYRTLQDSMPKICNFGWVDFVFEGQEFDEKIRYWNCKLPPDVDTIFYDRMEADDDAWDEFMDSI